MTRSSEVNVNDLRSLHILEECSLDIIEGHANVINTWNRSHRRTEDTYSTATHYDYDSRSGPNVAEALRHRNYKSLTDLSPVGWMDFYKGLRVQAAMFNVALMPFKCTHIQYKAYGMCISLAHLVEHLPCLPGFRVRFPEETSLNLKDAQPTRSWQWVEA